MDISKLRNITNNYQDVRLISLRNWKQASEVFPRDQAGPYAIAQQGFDPQDLHMIPTDFVLGRSGEWVRLQIFFGLPVELRRQEFIFGTAAEVMRLLDSLTGEVRVIRTGKELAEAEAIRQDDLNAALFQGKALQESAADRL
jgi:hypothetical protein